MEENFLWIFSSATSQTIDNSYFAKKIFFHDSPPLIITFLVFENVFSYYESVCVDSQWKFIWIVQSQIFQYAQWLQSHTGEVLVQIIIVNICVQL